MNEYIRICYDIYGQDVYDFNINNKHTYILFLVDKNILIKYDNLLNIFKDIDTDIIQIKNNIYRTILNKFINKNKYILIINNIKHFIKVYDNLTISNIIQDISINKDNVIFNLLKDLFKLFYINNNKVYTITDIIKNFENIEEKFILSNYNLFLGNLNLDKLMKNIKIAINLFLKDLNENQILFKNKNTTLTDILNDLDNNNLFWVCNTLIESVLNLINITNINVANNYILINKYFIKYYKNIEFPLLNNKFNLFQNNLQLITKYLFIPDYFYKINKNKLNIPVINNKFQELNDEVYYYISELLYVILKKYYSNIENYMTILNERDVNKIKLIYQDIYNLFGNNFINSFFVKNDKKIIKDIFITNYLMFYSIANYMYNFKSIYKYTYNYFIFKKYDKNTNEINEFMYINNKLCNIDKTNVILNIIKSIIIKYYMISINNDKNIIKENILINNGKNIFNNLNLKYNINTDFKMDIDKYVYEINKYVIDTQINLEIYEKLFELFKGITIIEESMQNGLSDKMYDIKEYDYIPHEKINSYFLYRLKNE